MSVAGTPRSRGRPPPGSGIAQSYRTASAMQPAPRTLSSTGQLYSDHSVRLFPATPAAPAGQPTAIFPDSPARGREWGSLGAPLGGPSDARPSAAPAPRDHWTTALSKQLQAAEAGAAPSPLTRSASLARHEGALGAAAAYQQKIFSLAKKGAAAEAAVRVQATAVESRSEAVQRARSLELQLESMTAAAERSAAKAERLEELLAAEGAAKDAAVRRCAELEAELRPRS